MIDGFIYAGTPTTRIQYILVETEKEFLENQKTQPIDWEYHNKKIYYCYNRYGHRSMEIEHLQNDYILASGCSITEGVGLAHEDIWPSVVAKELDRSVYNLGVGGSGPAVAVRNIITFFTKIKDHPSVIAIQWPEFYRCFRINKDLDIQHLNSGSAANDEYYRANLKDDTVFYNNIFERKYLLYFLQNIGYKGKIIEFFANFPEEARIITDHTKDLCLQTHNFLTPGGPDYARDLRHPGSKCHKIYAEHVLSYL